MKRDTIVALATGAGRAGVAIVRISGPHARDVLSAITTREIPSPRVAAKRAFFAPNTHVSIDDGLAVFFEGPASFTGEDVIELHVHGGLAVIAAIIEACLVQTGIRIAEPGEFTRRAFENGKLDLAEAEGLADLVDAETEGQRRQALRQVRGALSAVYEGWRTRLIEAAALIEAEIDFPDEDLPGALAQRAAPLLEALAVDMGRHLDDGHRGERVRDGFRIAIIGPPNAGKSSLLNALAQREAVIVSDIPGTTRDVVEVRLVLAGYPVWIADTAGLREAADAIEAEGVRRALARADEADLRLGVVEAGEPVPSSVADALRSGDLLIRSKSERRPVTPEVAGEFALSVVTGQGMAALEAAVAAKVADALGRDEAPALTRARHRRLVEEAQAALRRAVPALDVGPELAAEDVRAAAHAVGRLTGRIDVEDVLGEIFSSFCIGK
ncbi:MAG: tRNA uridine-5-carboxymethylaminomethyl(34) synthesis GTPase MnmE [Caulobacterales bacterium]|nr:tRNA uridine-5-carboxymethylaminomethyl(34) synthesis GTPase MnmE [Caulobacterales bacterium]